MILRRVTFSAVLIVFSLVFGQAQFIAHARYATPEDESVRCDFINRDIKVEADGRYTAIIEQKMTILNEAGRGLCPIMLTYHDDYESIEVLDAHVIVEGECVQVQKQDIEIKPLASDYLGLSRQYQVMVNFPRIVTGAQVYMKLKQMIKKPFMPGYFYTKFAGAGRWIMAANISIQSALPLSIKVNDPAHAMTIKESKLGSQHFVGVTLNKPILASLVNEPNTQLPETKETFVDIATHDTILPLLTYEAPLYEEKIKQPLPPLLVKILNEARAFPDDIAKINHITASLADHISYAMDSRTMEGHFVPRDLADIVDKGAGDCKDYTVCTAAILRQLGMKAEPTLVYRGESYIEPRIGLPNPGLFNHVMLRVTLPTAQVIWLDPTNSVSMAGKLFADIAGRSAYVLGDNPRAERIEDLTPQATCAIYDMNIEDKDDQTIFKGTLQLQGSDSAAFHQHHLAMSGAVLAEQFAARISGSPSPHSYALQFPPKATRIVQDLAIPFEIVVDDTGLFKTNQGFGKKIDTNLWNDFLALPDDVEGIFYTEAPYNIIKKRLFKGKWAQHPERLDVAIDTPWAKAERTCRQVGKDIVVTENFQIKAKFIPPQEAKSQEFKNLKKKLKENFSNTLMILKNH